MFHAPELNCASPLIPVDWRIELKQMVNTKIYFVT